MHTLNLKFCSLSNMHNQSLITLMFYKPRLLHQQNSRRQHNILEGSLCEKNPF
jgi:hypothetical protein